MNAPFMTAVQVPAIEWRTPDALLTEPPGKAYLTTDSLPATMRDAVRATARYVAAPEALAAQCFIAAGAYLAQTRVNAPQFRIEGFVTDRAVHGSTCSPARSSSPKKRRRCCSADRWRAATAPATRGYRTCPAPRGASTGPVSWVDLRGNLRV